MSDPQVVAAFASLAREAYLARLVVERLEALVDVVDQHLITDEEAFLILGRKTSYVRAPLDAYRAEFPQEQE